MKLNLSDMLQKASKHEAEDKSKNAVMACLIGPSGSGKSHAIGTSGCKTLYLYFAGEKHGKYSAGKEAGENLVPVCVDYTDLGDGKGDRYLTPDETLNYIKAILRNPQGLLDAGFEAVALDGLTELEGCILMTNELKKMSLSQSGKVDKFKETPNLKKIIRSIIKLVVEIQTKTGIHFFTTCIADVKEYDSDTKEILDCQPRLNSYSVAEDVIQQFGTYFLVNQIINPETGKGVHVFDFAAEMHRTSKDDKGRVKKTQNFQPRIQKTFIPEQGKMRADLSKIIEMVGKA